MELKGIKEDRPGGIRELLETLLLALSVSGIWYYCYYLLAPWIWQQNIPFLPQDITPWILPSTTEHDGVEIYALYIMAFVNIISAFAVSDFIRHLKEKTTRRIIVALCVAISCLYCATIGFTTPMNSFQATPLAAVIQQSLAIMLVTFPLIALLWYLQRRAPRWGVVLAALLLAPTCFLATSYFSWLDYSYIFAPALRLIKGAALSDIYFQYDLLLSLLAAGWMKLGWELSSFQLLGQAAYYLTILGVFAFSTKIFKKKELAVFLLAALVLGRLYASPWDATQCFQVTPLRIDLWLPLLVLVYYLGPFHWSAGLLCGLLLIFHKTFGIIYSAAYIQLLLTLCAIEYSDDKEKAPLLPSLMKYGRRFLAPGTIMAVSWDVSYFLFRNGEFPNYSGYYQKIGIGFIQIAPTSFYWYIPAILSTVVILLFRLRKKVPTAYTTTGFLLTYCAIGNSIYFFGRSHEHNILNIAIVLLFLFFFMLDLIARSQGEEVGNRSTLSFRQKHGVVVAAAALVIAIIVSYSGNIAGKGKVQYLAVSSAQPIVSTLSPNIHDYLNKIKGVTGNSSKVYFIDETDFVFYYYGGYAPAGYCNPFQTWIFTKDMNGFLQGLLDSGYYLVCNPALKYVLDNLSYTNTQTVGDTVVVAKSIRQAAKR